MGWHFFVPELAQQAGMGSHGERQLFVFVWRARRLADHQGTKGAWRILKV
jgi:hypothetical protein